MEEHTMNDMKDELERRFAARMDDAGISAHSGSGDDSPKARRRVQRAKAAQFDDLVLSYNALLSRTGRTDRMMRRLVKDVENFLDAMREGKGMAEARMRLGDTLDYAYVFDGTEEE
jgi:hypothetical protein